MQSSSREWPVVVTSSKTGAADAHSVNHAFTIQGARLGEAIVSARKNIENRFFRLGPGWYAVHVVKLLRNSSTAVEQMLDSVEGLPAADSLPLGSIIGVALISRSIQHELVHPSEVWAIHSGRMYCNIISHVVRLRKPIACGGNLGAWKLGADVREQVVAALVDSGSSVQLATCVSPRLSPNAGDPSGPLPLMLPSEDSASAATDGVELQVLGSATAPSAPAVFTCAGCNRVFESWRALTAHSSVAGRCRMGIPLAIAEASRIDSQISMRDRHYKGNMQDAALEGLSHLRMDKLASDSMMVAVKEVVRSVLDIAGAELERTLGPMVSPDRHDEFQSAVHTIMDVWNGLETTAKEEAAAMRRYPYLQVHERKLGYMTQRVVDAEGFEHSGKTKVCSSYHIKIEDLLQRLFQHDSRAWQQVRASQTHWREAVAKRGGGGFVIGDVCDGDVFAEHPELGRYFTEHPEFQEGLEKYRLACGIYSDGVATENPLGFARGKHSIECFYMVLFNLDPSVRMSTTYIMPIMLCLTAELKQFGPCFLFSGATNDKVVRLGSGARAPKQIQPGGQIIASQKMCPGAELRSFACSEGVTLQVPITGADGITSLQGRQFGLWCISLHADFPAAGKLTPCPESTSALLPSRQSNWESTADNALLPSTFFNKFFGKPSDGRRALWELRSLRAVESQIQHAASLKGGRQTEYMRSVGLNSLAYAFQPSLVPCFDFTTMAMNDGMHGEGDGILGEECYQMVYMITRVMEWADYQQLNALKRGYPWHAGEEPPDLHESVQQGAKGNVPTKGTRIRFSASQTLRWAKHSVAFLRPVIQDPDAPFWKCWCKHVEYLNVLMQYSFTISDLEKLDQLVYEHQVSSVFTLQEQFSMCPHTDRGIPC